jgi:phosphinothricin acetyltransferase
LASVGFKFGRWVDTMLMRRELGTGAETLPRDVMRDEGIGSSGG